VPTGPGARVIVTTRAQAWPGALAQDIHELPLPAAIELSGRNGGYACEYITDRRRPAVRPGAIASLAI